MVLLRHEVFGHNIIVFKKIKVLLKLNSVWSFKNSTLDLFFLNHGFACLWVLKLQFLN